MKRSQNRSGFTLVEVMVTVGIVGILAAIATTQILRARDRAATVACQGNLSQLVRAKSLWAFENKSATADTLPPEDELFGPDDYLKRKPSCPSGGTYTLNSISEPPVCSQPGHVLAP